jgi:hypothetical protein
LSQDAPTSPALEAALEGIQARMSLIRSKKMRFEYTRAQKVKDSPVYREKCVLFAWGGNYREEAVLENGEKKTRYYFGVPTDNLFPFISGVRFDLKRTGANPEFSPRLSYAIMNWIDSTLVPQWDVTGEGYWETYRGIGHVRNDPEHPGAFFFDAAPGGVNRRYSSALGWAFSGGKWIQCSDFTQVEGIYWPRKIVEGNNGSEETLLISQIESDADFDPAQVEAPHPEPGWISTINYHLWKANPGSSIRDPEEAFDDKEIRWGKPLSPQEIRILTVAQSQWPGYSIFNKDPLPYYDKNRDVIVWAKYDTNLKQHLKVFEGDQLPASYGPLPWENIAIIVQKWIGKEAPPRPEGDTAEKQPASLQGPVSQPQSPGTQPAGTPSPSPSPAAPTLSQDTPTSPALEAALEGIQARMSLIRSRKMRFEYTRAQKVKDYPVYREKCVLFAYGGNYREEAVLENGEKKTRYYFGVPDLNGSFSPDKQHQHVGARFDRNDSGTTPEFSPHENNAQVNGIDSALVPQWGVWGGGYWKSYRQNGQVRNDPEHPGASVFEVEVTSNGADRYASALGWAYIGNEWTQYFDFTQVEGIYWPRKIVRGNKDFEEILLISKIESSADFDPVLLEAPRPERGWITHLSYPLWKADPGSSIRDPKNAFGNTEIHWGKPLSPQEIRVLTVALSRWTGNGIGEHYLGRYPLPYYDQERDVIVWAKRDPDLKKEIKVFEGDQLPASYGPLLWENIAKIVRGWTEGFTPDTTNKKSETGTPTPAKVIEAESGDFPADYLNQIIAALSKNFVLRPNVHADKPCTVRFKIFQDGRLAEPQVVEGQGTGVEGLDHLAINAVLKAGKIAPYPPEYSKQPFVYARVRFMFTPSPR